MEDVPIRSHSHSVPKKHIEAYINYKLFGLLAQALVLFCVCFSRQGFSVVLKPVLETSSCKPGWLQTHRDLPASAS